MISGSIGNYARIVAGLAIAFLIYFWGVSPKLKERGTVESQLESFSRRLDQMTERMRDFKPPDDEEKRSWEQSRLALEAMMASDEELPRLLEHIARIAIRNGISDVLIRAGEKVASRSQAEHVAEPPARQRRPRVAGEGNGAVYDSAEGAAPKSELEKYLRAVGYYPIEISFRGDYLQLGRMLFDLGQIKQLVEIERVEARRDPPRVSAKVLLRAYTRDLRAGPSSYARPAG